MKITVHDSFFCVNKKVYLQRFINGSVLCAPENDIQNLTKNWVDSIAPEYVSYDFLRIDSFVLQI